MIEVSIDSQVEAATELTLRAVHPDTWAFPFPHQGERNTRGHVGTKPEKPERVSDESVRGVAP